MKLVLRGAAALMSIVAMPMMLATPAAAQDQTEPSGYRALQLLYSHFRAIVPPPMVKGVPDYSPEAMARQYAELKALQSRLRAIDDSNWPISQRVDYMVVLAEMRGFEFQHRVLQPWKRDPAFYSTTNLGFGPKKRRDCSPNWSRRHAVRKPLPATLRRGWKASRRSFPRMVE